MHRRSTAEAGKAACPVEHDLGKHVKNELVKVQMRAAGFTLNGVCSGGRKRVCRYVFAPGEDARFVKLLDEDAAA